MATRRSVTVLLLALLNACATPRVVRLDTGQGLPLEYRPSSSNRSVEVDAEAFEEALARLVLDDGLGLGEWDKLGVALGLSLEPVKESIARVVEKTLAPQLFYTVIATGLITGSPLTVRQWLSTQSYEAQREFGLLAIQNIRKGIW